MRVIVLGAGLLGVTSAYFLQQLGHEVTVIDRQGAPGAETSFANGGQISVSHAEPWANPSAPLKVLQWLGQEDAPLLFRIRADMRQWLWGLSFLRNCTPARTRHNIEQIVRLGTYSRSPKVIDGVRAFTGAEQFNEFLAASRVLVNLLPLTPETANVMNKDTLGRLQPGAYVINVARGAHLVEEDLLALIDSGHVAGATLDVFRTEPLPAGHAFWNHPRITITPHTSARTLRDESIALIARKMAALERGEAVAGIVNPARGY